jgi:pimeloyl-ACP methyl ester carboxylesterase
MDEITTSAIATPDGRVLETVVTGPAEGPVLVYHSGTPSSVGNFPVLFDAAARLGLRTVWWSRAGYGTSTPNPGRSVADGARDTAAVLDALGVEEALVLGWSGGGPHALGTAAVLPERTLAVATLGGVAPFDAEGLDFLSGMAEENIEEFTLAQADGPDFAAFLAVAAELLAASSEASIVEGLGGLISPVDAKALEDYFAASLVATMRRAAVVSPAGWADDDRAFLRPWGFSVEEIRVPVAIWQGGDDRMVPFAHGAWLAAHLPGAVPHLLPEEGHLSLFSSIDDILDELCRLGGVTR